MQLLGKSSTRGRRGSGSTQGRRVSFARQSRTCPDKDDRSDGDLVEAVRTGDLEAMAVLYRRHHQWARRVARRYAADTSAADDLVSEAFIKVFQGIERGTGARVSFKGYLATTVRRVHVDSARRTSRERLVSPDGLPPMPVPDGAERSAENAVLLAAMAKVSPRWRSILWLTEVMGHSHHQVASMMGMTVNAVGVNRFRAREALRQAYLAEHTGLSEDPRCGSLTLDMPRYVRSGLPASKRTRLEQHLERCHECRAELVMLSELNAVLTGSPGGRGRPRKRSSVRRE